MIEGIKIKKLKIISDHRGRLMEILRSDDEIFKKFGQVYMTTVSPGIVKGWHYHKKQSDTIVCIKGKLRLGLYDSRKGSKTKGEIQEMMLADGIVDENEMEFCINMAAKLGFKKSIVGVLVRKISMGVKDGLTRDSIKQEAQSFLNY